MIGLSPRKAANSRPTGEACEAVVAALDVTPADVSPLCIALGSVLASPTAISVKNAPIESTMPAFMPVARIPDAAPRSAAGTAFMIAAEFGAAIRPIPMPLNASSSANAT